MRWIVLTAAGVLGCVVFVRYLEQKSLFYPSRSLALTPEAIGIPFEDVYVETSDRVRIHGWFLKAPGARATLLFFHGNAGNIGDRLGKISMFHGLGLNVFIIDYRGYGRSEGRPSEQGLYADAAAAHAYIKNRADVAGQKIVVYGASLGGAVAVDLAAKVPISAVILDSTFTSTVDMARRYYPFVPSFLIRSRFDSLSKIGRVSAPLLVMHSPADEIVAYDLGAALYAAAGGPKTFLDINGGHNEGYLQDQDKITMKIKEFLIQGDLL